MQMIEEELFKEYPPRPPTTHEIEQYRAAREALKQAAKRKATASVDPGPSAPGKEILPTSGDMTLPDVPANANVLQQTEDTRGNLTATATGTDGARKKSRVAAVYIPNIGTANFAFLIVLFQAQKGPERLEYLGKDDLMNRAEASGLADKPIQGEGKGQHTYSLKLCHYTTILLNTTTTTTTTTNKKKLVEFRVLHAQKKIELTIIPYVAFYKCCHIWCRSGLAHLLSSPYGHTFILMWNPYFLLQ